MKSLDIIMKPVYNIAKSYVQYYETPKWYIMNISEILVIYGWIINSYTETDWQTYRHSDRHTDR